MKCKTFSKTSVKSHASRFAQPTGTKSFHRPRKLYSEEECTFESSISELEDCQGTPAAYPQREPITFNLREACCRKLHSFQEVTLNAHWLESCMRLQAASKLGSCLRHQTCWRHASWRSLAESKSGIKRRFSRGRDVNQHLSLFVARRKPRTLSLLTNHCSRGASRLRALSISADPYDHCNNPNEENPRPTVLSPFLLEKDLNPVHFPKQYRTEIDISSSNSIPLSIDSRPQNTTTSSPISTSLTEGSGTSSEVQREQSRTGGHIPPTPSESGRNTSPPTESFVCPHHPRKAFPSRSKLKFVHVGFK